jgi:Tol biopolymer transport system component
VYPLDGGFDPVAVAALSSDSVRVDIQRMSGVSSSGMSIPVPTVTRPIVMHTSPAADDRDVPLNAMIRVVFSEPVSATGSGESVRLSAGGTSIPGRLGFADSAHVTLTFTPQNDLAPATAYALTILPGIENRDGRSVDSVSTVSFTAGRTELEHPSGQLVYSARGTDGGWHIFAVNADGTGLVQLTSGMTSDQSAVWSPDGSRIAFTRVWIDGNGNLVNQIAVMNADGSNRVDLALGSQPGWSPDGRRLVFTAQTGEWNRTGDMPFLATRLAVMNADGSGVRWLTSGNPLTDYDGSPAWSPDGAHIAYVRSAAVDAANGDWSSTINIMSPDGSGDRQLSSCEALSPSWTFDGHVLFWSACATSAGEGGLLVAGIDGAGSATPIATAAPISWGGGATMSPDGRWLVFTAPIPGRTQSAVYVTHVDGSATQQVAIGGGGAWRPTAPQRPPR